MALEPHAPKQSGDRLGDVVPAFADVDKAAAGMILRPVKRPAVRMRPMEEDSLLSSRLSGGSQGAAAAESVIGGRRRTDRLAAEQEMALSDGLGAMRGLAMVVGLYAVLGVLSLGGLMLWHWLR